MTPSDERSTEDQSDSKRHLKPDAVAVDGVLSMITDGIDGPHPPRQMRSLSRTSRDQLDAHERQRRYVQNQRALGEWIQRTVEVLRNFLHFQQIGEVIEVPQDMSLRVLTLDTRSLSDSAYARSVQGLLESKLLHVIQRAEKLRERLEDTTSRVLITGDLNSGKSSLCNALLRRDILPIDQQPCTEVFCEVLDATANNSGIEEVHAVELGQKYDRENPKTFKAAPLQELDNLVHESDKYALLKVYLVDPRPLDTSLLANGVVDICLIDAPGLNVSNLQTEEVFGRQEEIDLVIFVVSAENHFTQTAKDFVSDTAREKSLVFIVVNNFDKIRNQQRCRERILNQVADLAPETHKDQDDFVHFVTAPSPSHPPSGPSPPHGLGSPDFDKLEMSLRNFVLRKRSLSKLAPARTYLVNVLTDIGSLSRINAEIAKNNEQKLSGELADMEPGIDSAAREYAQVSEQIDRDVERLTHALFNQSCEHLSKAVTETGNVPLVPWTGLFDVLKYAAATRDSLVSHIQDAVAHCEDNARDVTATAVDAIKQLGVLHVGDRPAFARVFQKSAMFSRKRDNLGKSIHSTFGLTDIFDITPILERPLPVLKASKKALVSSSSTSLLSGFLTAFSVVGGTQLALGSQVVKAAFDAGWVDVRKLLLPISIVGVAGLGLWIVHELPRTIPRALSRKIAFEIDEMGYVQHNADRIASESRKVLKFPAQDVRAAFQSQLETQTRQREECERALGSAASASKHFAEVQGASEILLTEVRGCLLVDVD